MADAEVGDDGYREDPTVNELQAVYAERVGKAAALFVPSGVMANQIALRVLTQPGQSWSPGPASTSSPMSSARPAATPGSSSTRSTTATGPFARRMWCAPDRPPTTTSPPPAWSASRTRICPPVAFPGPSRPCATCARRQGPARAHGWRPLFNAEIATGVSAAEFADEATTVMSCLSKASAPGGVAPRRPGRFIEAAVIERKRLGGAMRQAGVLAAAGLVALQKMVDRLADDHAGHESSPKRWPSAGPMVAASRAGRDQYRAVPFQSAGRVLDHLRSEGVLADSIAPGLIRLMTHHDVDDAGIEQAKRAVAGAPH